MRSEVALLLMVLNCAAIGFLLLRWRLEARNRRSQEPPAEPAPVREMSGCATAALIAHRLLERDPRDLAPGGSIGIEAHVQTPHGVATYVVTVKRPHENLGKPH